MKDRVSLIKADGRRIDGIGAMVQPGKVFIADGNVPMEEGDVIERRLPNGLEERYVVLDRGYYAAFGGQAAHYQAKVEKDAAIRKTRSATTVYNVTGPNARVNVQSVDASTNIVSVDPGQLFEQMRDAVRTGVAEVLARDELVERIDRLQAAVASPDYLSAYQKFIATSANHMTLLAPFLPPLAQLIGR